MNKNKYKIPFDQDISINTDIFEKDIRIAVYQGTSRILLTDSYNNMTMQLEDKTSYFRDLNSILFQLTQSMGINVE